MRMSGLRFWKPLLPPVIHFMSIQKSGAMSKHIHISVLVYGTIWIETYIKAHLFPQNFSHMTGSGFTRLVVGIEQETSSLSSVTRITVPVIFILACLSILTGVTVKAK